MIDQNRQPTLEGNLVRLVPLSMKHKEALVAVGLDPSIWKFTPFPIETEEQMEEYLKRAFGERDRGQAIPFSIIEKADEEVVGSTRYGNIDPFNRRVEIGWTWLAPRWQRSGINTEAKLLLLEHAFQELKCVRVEFKTDALNFPSRNALVRIGAKEEGTLRKHMVTATPRMRDTVYYSILFEEWPQARKGLLQLLERGNKSS
jgi:RimJ/RimL family protein N-acetyltransferase